MIKAILLVFDPANTWDGIVQDRRRLPSMLLFFLLPLLLITSTAEGYGLLTWGKWFGGVMGLKRFSPTEVVVYEVLQLLLSLVVVFLGALLLKALGDTFHGRHNYTQAFRAVAYGLSPLFCLRLLDIFRSVPWWVPWAIGILLAVSILYQGVPRVMEPDPPHALGLYLTCSFLLVMISGLGRFLSAWWLMGKFPDLQNAVLSFITSVLAR